MAEESVAKSGLTGLHRNAWSFPTHGNGVLTKACRGSNVGSK